MAGGESGRLGPTRRGGDPYFLYAASNVGSMVGFWATRHLGLVPVLAAQAEQLGMAALVRTDDDADLPASIST